MKLGIPTLNQYGRLTDLIRSAEKGSVKPDEYIVIDNGGTFEAPPELAGRVRVEKPGENIGVARSWNALLDMVDGPIAISNDDIVFGVDTFRSLRHAALESPFVGACGGWALFAQNKDCTEKVGYYDEHFFPAYYEDCDYLLRLKRAEIPVRDLGWLGAVHAGEASTKTASEADRALIADGRTRNYSYFVTKWGSDSPRWGNPHVTNFDVPFNGRYPEDWTERVGANAAAKRTLVSPLRYDVLNALCELIGVKRYLEIGVSDGDTMRRIVAKEKWGIDPFPQLSAVHASSIFVPKTSDVFFAELSGKSMFDLIFIDGDHRAEQVYREVRSALAKLSDKGVICLHDCSPHTEEMQEVPHRTGWQWTGDVWKAIARLRSEGYFVRVIPSDFGIGIIIPENRAPMSPRIALPATTDRLLYKDLVADREHILGLLRPGEWAEFLAKHCMGL